MDRRPGVLARRAAAGGSTAPPVGRRPVAGVAEHEAAFPATSRPPARLAGELAYR